MSRGVLYARSDRVLSRSFAGEVLLAAPGVEDVDQLSGPAADVWALLEWPSELEAIVVRLSQAYSAPEARVREDVARLLDDLAGREWVRAVDDTDG